MDLLQLSELLQIDDISCKQFTVKNELKLKKLDENISIKYIDTIHEFQKLIKHLYENEIILGIDIEQSDLTSYNGNICLIQIATKNHDSFIIDILMLKNEQEILKIELEKIFANKKIQKIFYHGSNDIKWIHRDFNIQTQNYFDIQIIAKHLKIQEISLLSLVQQYCNVNYEKQLKKQMQMSRWDLRPLTYQQKFYAVFDCFYLIYLRYVMIIECFKIIQKKQSIIQDNFDSQQMIAIDNVKQQQQNNELFLSIQQDIQKAQNNYEFKEKKFDPNSFLCQIRKKNQDYDSKIIDTVMDIAKLRDSQAKNQDVFPTNLIKDEEILELLVSKNINQLKSNLESSQNHFIQNFQLQILSFIEVNISLLQPKYKLQSSVTKEIRLNKYLQMSTSKKPIYENCCIQDPSGNILGYCDERKVNWYLNKKIAVLIQENPKHIRLNFEPSGRFSTNDNVKQQNEFYSVNRENICVVCGTEKFLARFNIVPSTYKMHMPIYFKDHCSHDVVVLCYKCREKTNKYQSNFIKKLCQEYDCPLFQFNDVKIKRDLITNFVNQTNSIIQLINKNPNIPQERLCVLKSRAQNLFDQLTQNGNQENEDEYVEKLFEIRSKYQINQSQLEYNQNLIDFNEELIQIKNFGKNKSNKEFKNNHGLLVVQKLKDDQEIEKFIFEWRRQFIDQMKPKYLPHNWNINTPFDRQHGEYSIYRDKI